jgi:hypothetical protein
MSAPDSIRALVERFEANRVAYRSQKYNETQARREFIDPFFKALGCVIFRPKLYHLFSPKLYHRFAAKVYHLS